MFDYMDLFFLRNGFTHVDNAITSQCSKQSPRRNSLKPSEPCPEPTPARAGTLRNLRPELTTLRNLPPKPAPARAGTLQNLHQHAPNPRRTCLRNLHLHAPEPSGTFRNLSPEPAPATRTGTHRSLSGLKTP